MIKTNLISQRTSPVRWTQIMKNMLADGATEIVEIGPGKVLQGLFKKVDRKLAVSSVTL
jgi:[acyl-carrier-protein] S-malonyltransferase